MLFVSKKVAVQIYLKIYHFNDLSAEKQQSINMILGGGMPFEYCSSLKMLAIFTLLRYTTGFYFAFPGSNYSE